MRTSLAAFFGCSLFVTGCAGPTGGLGSSYVHIERLTIATVAGEGCAVSRGIQRDQGTQAAGDAGIDADARAQAADVSSEGSLGFALATALSSLAECGRDR